MKTNVIAALIVAAGLSAVSAQAAETYAGVNAGRSEAKLSVPGAGSLKESDTAVKLYTGMQFDKTFGAEAGYVHHGKPSASAGGDSLAAKPRSFYVAATATLPLAQNFSLFGKVGASYNRVEFSATGQENFKEKNTSALLGIGAAYAFTANLSGVVEYEDFGKLAKTDVFNLKANVVSVGIRSTF